MIHKQVQNQFCVDVRAGKGFIPYTHFKDKFSRSQNVTSLGQLLVSQLRQIPGCSTSAAVAISEKFGGTLASITNKLKQMPPHAAEDTISQIKKKGLANNSTRILKKTAFYTRRLLTESKYSGLH
jgi:hypothetical protein